MNSLLKLHKVSSGVVNNSYRMFSVTVTNNDSYKCKVLVVGGGSGGAAMTAKFANKFGKGKVIVLEPNEDHYYQPLFTLVGGGMTALVDTKKSMKQTLSGKAKWIKDSAVAFEPENNVVITDDGDRIEYEALIIAMGLTLHYEKIPGLVEALSKPNNGVCSNYSPKYVDRTLQCLKNFKEGNAIFTFPIGPVKCPGAPQKACYISEDYFRRNNKRDKAKVIYNTALPVLFGVKHYADALWEIVKKRDIEVNLRTNLIEVNSDKRTATFENLDNPSDIKIFNYEMLHVTPPMSTPDALKTSSLVDANGFVDVSKDTLQHTKYKNVFAIGDNSNSPNSKTGASAAAQSPILYKNILAFLNGQPLQAVYDGYASCPLVTGYSTCMLAEFDYSLKPLETFPMPQNKERHTMFFMKKNLLPPVYWHLMMNGYWNGPKLARQAFGLFKFGGN
jgi:sulfide:quinone oxidoreductase